MTDTQILTLAFAIIFPLSMLLYSNSRITEAKETLRADIGRVEGTLGADLKRVEGELRAEVKGVENRFSSELKTAMLQLNNKLDHIIETQADHSNRLEKLENR